MAKMLSLKECIDKFNSKEKVYIPLYQRNYKWPDKKKNAQDNPSAEKLIEDLIEHYDTYKSNDTYLLGMITVHAYDKGYEILDGQQRMITLSLIIKAICHLAHKNLQQDCIWFELKFERDRGFDDVNTQDLPRYNAIYRKEAKGVDVERMNNNYIVIKEKIEEASKNSVHSDYCINFYKHIMNNVSIIFRESKEEPVEEFLNLNFNKTPFGTGDYLKSYMIMDCNTKSENIITSVKIIEIWKNLQFLLYKLDRLSDASNLENEMYKLVKHNYAKEKVKIQEEDIFLLDIHRMEMLFSDRYSHKGKKYLKKDARRLEDEYDQLIYYSKSMQSVLDEFWIVDQDGKEHPNYNVYSAYRLLCKQYPETRFFKLLDDSNNIDVLGAIYNKFNLLKAVGKKESKSDNPNLRNQFMESLLVSKKDENTYCKQYNNEKNSIYSAIKSKEYVKKVSDFQDMYSLFEKKLDEYVEIINKGKDCINQIGQGKLSLNEIMTHPKVKQIKIPAIQRDYVMGSNKDYLRKYLEKLSFYYWWNCFNQIKSSFESSIDNDILDLFEQKMFIDNNAFNGNLMNPLEEITDKNNQKKEKYNSITSRFPHFKKENSVNKFGTGAPTSEYISFCNAVNNFKKDFDTIIEKLKNNKFNKPIAKQFNSSVIMGYLDNMGTLWIYDGQQRLTTSLALIGYLQCGKYSEQFTNILSFEGRDGANNCLNLLYQNSDKEYLLKQMEQYIDDKTSHSIYRLIENYAEFSEKGLVKINTEFLLHGVQYEFVQVDSINDAEQLFMDLNDGLQLEGYEKYKAELSYLMGKIYQGQVNKRREFLLSLDNEWLNAWGSEEKEFKILQWCIQQSYFERREYNEKRTFQDLTNLDEEVLDYAKQAMDVLNSCSQNLENISLNKCLWINILLFNKEINEKYYYSNYTEISFKNDFTQFILLYEKFARKKSIDNKNITNEDINKQIYIMIKEFRDTEKLKIDQNLDNNSVEGLLNNLCRNMLTNRINKAEFDEIIYWEEAEAAYEDVQKNKEKSYALEHVNVDKLQTPTIEYTSDKAILSWKDIVKSLSGNIIKAFLEYYFYNNNESISITFEIPDSIKNKWTLEFLYRNNYFMFDNNGPCYNNGQLIEQFIDNNGVNYYKIIYGRYTYQYTKNEIVAFCNEVRNMTLEFLYRNNYFMFDNNGSCYNNGQLIEQFIDNNGVNYYKIIYGRYIYQYTKNEIVAFYNEVCNMTLEFLYRNNYFMFDNNEPCYSNGQLIEQFIDNSGVNYYKIIYGRYIYQYTKNEIVAFYNEVRNMIDVKNKFFNEWGKISYFKQYISIKLKSDYLKYIIESENNFNSIFDAVKLKRGEMPLKELHNEIDIFICSVNKASSKLKQNASTYADKITLVNEVIFNQKYLAINLDKKIELILKHYKYIDKYTKEAMPFKCFIATAYFSCLLQDKLVEHLEKLYWITKEYLQVDDSLRQGMFVEYMNSLHKLNDKTRKKIRRLFKKDDFEMNSCSSYQSVIKEKEEYLSYIGLSKASVK